MKKIMVITGASSGMGREYIRQLSEKYPADEIWAIGRSKERLEELKQISAIPVCPIRMDLSRMEEIRAQYTARLEAEKPEITALINDAGFGAFDHTENLSTDLLLNMIDLNDKACVAMISDSLPYMAAGGNIVNMASCAGFQPIPYINC